MPTEWMRNLDRELANITQADINNAELEQEFPDPRCVVGEVGFEIRRLIALKKKYFDIGVACDDKYQIFEERGEKESAEARKLDRELKHITMNIDAISEIINLSILTAFPELFEKHAFLVVKGWKVVGVDAEIVVEQKPLWHHSPN